MNRRSNTRTGEAEAGLIGAESERTGYAGTRRGEMKRTQNGKRRSATVALLAVLSALAASPSALAVLPQAPSAAGPSVGIDASWGDAL